MAWLKIGLRNLIKNSRRSLITILAIALAFATVNLFSGFATYMHKGNQRVAIYAMQQGHLVVFAKGFREKGRLQAEKYLLTAREIDVIRATCARYPAVEMVTPQLYLTGLLSNGRISTIFVAQGVVPSASAVFGEHLKKMASGKALEMAKQRRQGEELQDDKPSGVAVSGGLAKLLDLKLGDTATAMANTEEGRMNALDAEVRLIFNAGSEQTNDKLMLVPFAFAQSLFDTQGADRMAVLLRETEQTEAIRTALLRDLSAAGLNVEIMTWDQMSEWYRKVKSMFDTIFNFLFVIVFIIVVMSVVNTMGMAVMERTREIGTMRALGVKRRGILTLFAIESALLGVIGSCVGLVLTAVGWAVVRIVQPTWSPPGLSSRFVIWIEWVPATLAISFACLVVLCFVASVIPARRAAGMNIVDSLGHV